MKRNWITGLCLLGLTALSSASSNDALTLKIDYSGRQQCGYSVDYTSQGNFKQKGAVSTKSTTIRCRLLAVKTATDLLTAAADSVSIVSDIYKEEEKKRIIDQLSKTHYTFSLKNGFPTPDTAAPAPAGDYVEWDLYRQLLKLLPTLPEKAVKPGFTWERTATLPLQTARGRISCEIYRAYTFNKVKGDSAFISWMFRYAAAKKGGDSADVLNRIPVSGNGTGAVVLDLKNNCILSAEMDFTTPVATIGEVSVTWKEHASCKMTSGK